MFTAVFKAFKRVVDLTLVPALVSILLLILEFAVSAVSWVLVTAADFVLFLVGSLLSIIPVPDGLALTAQTFGEGFLDVANIVGLFPALALYFAGAGVALITRILTGGIVGR